MGQDAFVVACCPARNRAWILPTWLRAMEAQDRRPDALYVLLNDCDDDSRAVLIEHGGSIPLVVDELNTGDPGWDRIEPRYSTANIAKLRNEMVERVLRRWPEATHLWSCDSDVEPLPDCLSKLLANDIGFTSAVVRNGDAVWNFMLGWEGQQPMRTGREGSHLRVFNYMKQPFPVMLAGACSLIHRAVLDERGARYGADPRGEDFPFCASAPTAYLVPHAHTLHHMTKGSPPLHSLPVVVTAP